jgi:hypothetical protein
VGNDKGHYWLFCDAGTPSCINLQAGKNYLLFDSHTRWKLPGATDFMTLAFIQDFTVKYTKGENIGLIPEGADGANRRLRTLLRFILDGVRLRERIVQRPKGSIVTLLTYSKSQASRRLDSGT